MDNGIFHYNFGWDDYGVTSISTLLDMVRVFKFATDEGVVAVHCHAGEPKPRLVAFVESLGMGVD